MRGPGTRYRRAYPVIYGSRSPLSEGAVEQGRRQLIEDSLCFLEAKAIVGGGVPVGADQAAEVFDGRLDLEGGAVGEVHRRLRGGPLITKPHRMKTCSRTYTLH